jgi:hypothetical protein
MLSITLKSIHFRKRCSHACSGRGENGNSDGTMPRKLEYLNFASEKMYAGINSTGPSYPVSSRISRRALSEVDCPGITVPPKVPQQLPECTWLERQAMQIRLVLLAIGRIPLASSTKSDLCVCNYPSWTTVNRVTTGREGDKATVIDGDVNVLPAGALH